MSPLGGPGFSSVAEIAGGMGLRSPQPQQLALDFAPAQVRSHGLRDAHTYPQVARGQGASFRVPASQAWGYPSLELRAGNSWPLMGFDCDVPLFSGRDAWRAWAPLADPSARVARLHPLLTGIVSFYAIFRSNNSASCLLGRTEGRGPQPNC